jgi:hypothetical protein
MTQTSFGRRPAAKSSPAAPLPVMTKFSRPGEVKIPAKPASPSVDDEVKEWKKARGFTFPLKPVALMASLCFGVGSFALPASVTEWAQWPLYALSAASLYVGFGRRKPRPRA